MESPPSSGIRYRPGGAPGRGSISATVVSMSNDTTSDGAADTSDTSDASGTGGPEHPDRPRWLTTALVAAAALVLGIGGGLLLGSRDTAVDGGHEHGNATAIGFSQDMIVHHQQAVEMAQTVIVRGTDPKVRGLAVTMLTDQNREIGQMTGWLQAWDAPVVNPGAPMSWMDHHGGGQGGGGGHGDHDGHGATTSAPADDQAVMAGMATTAEMDRLSSLTGAAADTYFLQLMLRHHQGGHPMMSMVIDPESGTPAYVRALALQMDKAQTAEEATMKQLLAQRNTAPTG